MIAGSDLIQILRKNHGRKKGGLTLLDKATEDVIAIMGKIKPNKKKYISSSVSSKEKKFQIDPNKFYILPHVPLGRERFNILVTGEGGMGKSSLVSLMMRQTHQLITKKIYYICGTDTGADQNMKKLKFLQTISGEELEDIVVERDFTNSLVCFDDIDNWQYHKEAIRLLNQIYETGRKLKINLIYISHNTTKATESRIYNEVDLYITNKAKNNRMFQHYLNLTDEKIEEMDNYLKEDVFVCYNKIFDTVYTDKRCYRLE